jgi:hypothetical protein
LPVCNPEYLKLQQSVVVAYFESSVQFDRVAGTPYAISKNLDYVLSVKVKERQSVYRPGQTLWAAGGYISTVPKPSVVVRLDGSTSIYL